MLVDFLESKHGSIFAGGCCIALLVMARLLQCVDPYSASAKLGMQKWDLELIRLLIIIITI